MKLIFIRNYSNNKPLGVHNFKPKNVVRKKDQRAKAGHIFATYSVLVIVYLVLGLYI